MFLISPAEHSPLIQSLGPVSSLCEENGVDILSVQATARVGFQRKEMKDFYASLSDGRLQKELLQIESSSILTHAVLILEGNFDFSTDGQSTNPFSNISRNTYRSILTSIQLQSIIIQHTDSIADTVDLICGLSGYFGKKRHQSLSNRPNPRSQWGRTTSRGFAVHLLQSFPSIGPELADRIYQHFHGVPIAWTTDVEGLSQVAGIGKKRAKDLLSALEGPEPDPVSDAGVVGA